MKLTGEELRFLTVLAREQNQSGCRGPAHDLLRRHVYPDAPTEGPGSLTFAYEAVPLTGMVVREFDDLEQIDDFLRKEDRSAEVEWPWSSGEMYRTRLDEARREWKAWQEAHKTTINGMAGMNAASLPRSTGNVG